MIWNGSQGIEKETREPEMGVIESCFGGAHGVMVIVVGNGHGDTSSNPGRDW